MLSRFPFPTEKGDKLRAYHQLQELAQYWEIHLICLTEHTVSNTQQEKIKPFVKSLHIYHLNRFLILWNVFLQFFGNKPFQVGYFYQKRIHQKVKLLLEDIKPNHIYTQLIRTTEYVKNYHDCKKTLDYMDTLSAGMKRRVATEPFYKKWFFKAEWKRLARYENLVFDYFDIHTIISEQDRDLIAHPSRAKIIVIPNGVDKQYFDRTIDRPTPEFDIVFTGNLSYPPNVEAVKFIATKLKPEALKQGLNLKILISGANPSAEILKFSNEVEITGWVEDIRDSYAKGKLFVAPMFIGSGLQNKLLEAMAMKLPCITTPLANNALGASSSEICLAETPEEFIQWISMLLNDQQFSLNLAENGCRFVQQHFDWQQTTAKLSHKMLSTI